MVAGTIWPRHPPPAQANFYFFIASCQYPPASFWQKRHAPPVPISLRAAATFPPSKLSAGVAVAPLFITRGCAGLGRRANFSVHHPPTAHLRGQRDWRMSDPPKGALSKAIRPSKVVAAL